MKTKLFPTILLTALFAMALSCLAGAEDTVAEARDLKMTINKKGSIYPTKFNGEIETVHFEIIAQTDERAILKPGALSIEYTIFYFEDSVSLRPGGTYHKLEGSLSFGSDREAQKKALITKGVKIHDTVVIRNNNRRRNNNNNNNNDYNENQNEVTGERKDKLVGILVEVFQGGKLVGRYADRSRIVKIAEKLTKKGESYTAEAFK